MTINGVTCQDIAFELLLPLRTVQGHLYYALRILNLSCVEELTHEVIAAHYATTPRAADVRSDQRGISDTTGPGEPLNSLVALDEAEALRAHQEDVARMAALTLELAAACVKLEQQADTVRELREAVDSRDIIGQAKGLLMERHRITAHAAFAMLTSESSRSGSRTVDVARNLIRSDEGPTAGSA